MDVIRNIRTDLDAFSEVEQAVLMNHGYTLVDAAVRTHAPELIATDAAFAVPFPSFATPAVEEDELRQRLTGSQSRKLRGRS
jgi:NTE family protein